MSAWLLSVMVACQGSGVDGDADDSEDTEDTEDTEDSEDTEDTDDGGPTAAGVDWPAAWDATTGARVWQVTQGDGVREMSSRTAGADELDGALWSRVEVGDLTSTADDRFVVWVDGSRRDHARFKKLAWYAPGDDAPSEAYTLDQALDAAVDGDIDEAIPSAAAGVLELFGTSYAIDATATITLVGVDETLDLPFGALDGCARFALDIVIDEPSVGFTLSFDAWVHPTAGLVATDDFLGGATIELARAP